MNSFHSSNKPLLIAEIGGNHEGDFNYATKLTKLACESGADAVKFQIYTGDTLVSPIEDSERNKHFKKFELSMHEYISLAKICDSYNVDFTSSIWDSSVIKWIDKYMSFYKIGSGDLTAYPLLKEIAILGKPIVLSTGLSTFDEVKESIKFIQKINPIYNSPKNLAVLQCTSMYPIQIGDANLKVMHKYKKEFGLSIGYSDHTEGDKAVKQAINMGADVIEFHFTDSRKGKKFRDHKVSFTKDEVKSLVDYVKQVDLINGSENKKPLKSELDSGHTISFRRAVYPFKNIKKGEALSENNLTVLRPNHGIDARNYFNILGKKAKRDLSEFEKLEWDDIE